MKEFPDGCSYEDGKEYIWIGLLGFCGCYGGSYDLFFETFGKIYIARKNDASYFYDYKDTSEAAQTAQELCLMILDSKEWTEHGGSVRGSWITEKGFKIYEDFILNKSGGDYEKNI